MKTNLFAAFLIAAATVAPNAVAQDAKEASAKRQAPPIKVEMKKLDKALDAVADFLKKPEGDAPMAEIAAAQKALQESKQHQPRATERQPDGERASYVIDYKLQINATPARHARSRGRDAEARLGSGRQDRRQAQEPEEGRPPQVQAAPQAPRQVAQPPAVNAVPPRGTG